MGESGTNVSSLRKLQSQVKLTREGKGRHIGDGLSWLRGNAAPVDRSRLVEAGWRFALMLG